MVCNCVRSRADADEQISCELSLELGQGCSCQISSADHRNTTVGSKHTLFPNRVLPLSLDQLTNVFLGIWSYLEELLLDIGGA